MWKLGCLFVLAFSAAVIVEGYTLETRQEEEGSDFSGSGSDGQMKRREYTDLSDEIEKFERAVKARSSSGDEPDGGDQPGESDGSGEPMPMGPEFDERDSSGVMPPLGNDGGNDEDGSS